MVKPVAWLRGKSSLPTAKSSKSLNALEETTALSQSLQAMDAIMGDDLVLATKILEQTQPKSSFPALGRGVLAFIEATLGFEADVIKEATEKLRLAEAAASRDRIRAQKTKHVSSSFAPGTEYYLAIAEAHIMSAVVLFLSESTIASVKSFYKLRRAYQILAEIYNSNLDDSASFQQLPQVGAEDENEEEDEAALEDAFDALNLKLSDEQELSKEDGDLSAIDNSMPPPSPAPKFKPFGGGRVSNRDRDARVVDEYIQSGVNLCFGILQLVISMIPPALGRILSIIGFRGDRDTSIQMLWEATSSENIHGGLALLTLLMYYTGPAQVCDIETDKGLFPKERLLTELARTRQRYPNSALWLLQEARMQGMTGDLERCLATLNTPITIQMRQIEALVEFERAMCYLDLHQFETAAKAFIHLTTLNTWSHALYTFVAGACYVELYRAEVISRTKNDAKAERYKKAAEEYFQAAPKLIGRRRIIGRAMPLEIYLTRKIQKWTACMPAAGKVGASPGTAGPSASIVDYVGVSPANEIIYFWNGYKRMPRSALEKSLLELNYHLTGTSERIDPRCVPTTACEHFVEKAKAFPHITDIDELGVTFMLESIVLRNLGYVNEGMKLLLKEVMPIDRNMVKGKEEWVPPSAIYERGVFEWMSKGESGKEATLEWLNKAAHYSHEYELSTRIGVRIQTGIEVLKS